MKIFGFVKKVFFIRLTILSNFKNASSLGCVSMNNQACKARPEIINVNNKECRLDSIVCNNKQRWNKDKCRCECKELIDKGVCDKGYVWNPRNCDCECEKSCDFDENLDYENCKC